MDKLKLAKVFRCSARQLLLLSGLIILLHSLMSGSENYGGGFKGIIMNSSNALPWLLLFVLLLLAWKKELLGGILITVFGIISMYFYIFRPLDYKLIVLVIICLIIIFGIFFILSWYLRKKINYSG